MSPAVVAFNRGRVSARRIQEVIGRQPAIDARAPGGDRPVGLRGDLALEAVRFAYPARQEDVIFEALDLQISVSARAPLLIGVKVIYFARKIVYFTRKL